jgi:hypothetical protein
MAASLNNSLLPARRSAAEAGRGESTLFKVRAIRPRRPTSDHKELEAFGEAMCALLAADDFDPYANDEETQSTFGSNHGSSRASSRDAVRMELYALLCLS